MESFIIMVRDLLVVRMLTYNGSLISNKNYPTPWRGFLVVCLSSQQQVGATQNTRTVLGVFQ